MAHPIAKAGRQFIGGSYFAGVLNAAKPQPIVVGTLRACEYLCHRPLWTFAPRT